MRSPDLAETLYERGWVWTSSYHAGDRNWSHPSQPNQSYTFEAAIQREGFKAK